MIVWSLVVWQATIIFSYSSKLDLFFALLLSELIPLSSSESSTDSLCSSAMCCNTFFSLVSLIDSEDFVNISFRFSLLWMKFCQDYFLLPPCGPIKCDYLFFYRLNDKGEFSSADVLSLLARAEAVVLYDF